MTCRCEELRAQVSFLKARISDLTGGDRRAARIFKALRFSPQECAVLAVLTHARGRPVSVSALWTECFQRPSGDGPEVRAVDVIISRLRASLRREGAPGQIGSLRGFRYATPDLCDWVDARISADGGAA